MSEIEKMYDNAGVNKKCIDKRYEKCTGVCYDCKYFIYPLFTGEKQLELIKWLASKNYGEYKQSLLINIKEGRTYFSSGVFESDDGNGMYEDYCFRSKSFEEALAGIITNIWQDLTEVEQEQIRRILNE